MSRVGGIDGVDNLPGSVGCKVPAGIGEATGVGTTGVGVGIKPTGRRKAECVGV